MMEQSTYRKLEFDKVKNALLSHATSVMTQERIRQLAPLTKISDVEKAIQETDEAITVYRLKGNVPLRGVYDIRPHVKRATISGMLNPHELYQIGNTLRQGRHIQQFIEGLLEEAPYPQLEAQTERIVVLRDMEVNIEHAVDESGEVLDSASPTLRTLRQKRRSQEARVRERLESMIRGANASKMLSDQIVTIRNERFVLPVKQEYRGHYGGIVHDQSASGQTLFIEPQSIVELNNGIQQAKVEEQREIERILLAFTEQVAELADILLTNLDAISRLDWYFTKARYGQSVKGTKPRLNDEGRVRLVKARHPLLPDDEVVPNTIEIGDTFTTMVITGPNTGGKTVALKTLGLLVTMAQSGLFLPVEEGSEVGVFTQIFADIGDEQSIEQSLSTFSSHMVNIVEILQKADEKSLVLFDELGAGTDPQEGAALAISILDNMHQRKACVVATTHYPELKAYGYNRERVTNASVEFDIETLSPTYRLLIGIPGRSNAFEISKRLGLSEDLIGRAKSLISEDSAEVDQMIASLESSRRAAEIEEQEARDFAKSAEKLLADLQDEMQQYHEKKLKWHEKAREEAKLIVDKARKEAENIVQELHNMKSTQAESVVKDHELIRLRKKLDELVPDIPVQPKAPHQKKEEASLQPGDDVKVVSFDQKGQLLEKVDDNHWQVQLGILKMKVATSDLVKLKQEKNQAPKPMATVRGSASHVKLELDLRGERFEAAITKVEKYIDDALLAGYPRVSIIHGKGTGALRKGVQDFLKQHRSVKDVRYGEASEGGNGVTIVVLG